MGEVNLRLKIPHFPLSSSVPILYPYGLKRNDSRIAHGMMCQNPVYTSSTLLCMKKKMRENPEKFRAFLTQIIHERGTRGNKAVEQEAGILFRTFIHGPLSTQKHLPLFIFEPCHASQNGAYYPKRVHYSF